MIIGLLLMHGLTCCHVPITLEGSLPAKPPLTRSAEPFRSNVEIKYLFSEYGAVVKERRPNRWERLALAVMKSDVLGQ
jgi:hypothetical protein